MFSDHHAGTSKEQQSVLPDPHSQGGYPLGHFPELPSPAKFRVFDNIEMVPAS